MTATISLCLESHSDSTGSCPAPVPQFLTSKLGPCGALGAARMQRLVSHCPFPRPAWSLAQGSFRGTPQIGLLLPLCCSAEPCGLQPTVRSLNADGFYHTLAFASFFRVVFLN